MGQASPKSCLLTLWTPQKSTELNKLEAVLDIFMDFQPPKWKNFQFSEWLNRSHHFFDQFMTSNFWFQVIFCRWTMKMRKETRCCCWPTSMDTLSCAGLWSPEEWPWEVWTNRDAASSHILPPLPTCCMACSNLSAGQWNNCSNNKEKDNHVFVWYKLLTSQTPWPFKWRSNAWPFLLWSLKPLER